MEEALFFEKYGFFWGYNEDHTSLVETVKIFSEMKNPSLFQYLDLVLQSFSVLKNLDAATFFQTISLAVEVYTHFTKEGLQLSASTVGNLIAWGLDFENLLDVIEAYPNDLKLDDNVPLFNDKFIQNQIFETKFNASVMIKSLKAVPLRAVLIPEQHVELLNDNLTPQSAKMLFAIAEWNGSKVMPVPLHPFNTSDKASGYKYSKDNPCNVVGFGSLKSFDVVARPTASRTLYATSVFKDDIVAHFGLKLPTNHVESNLKYHQNKTGMSALSELSSNRTAYIQEVNDKFQFPAMVIDEYGVMLVSDPEVYSEIGGKNGVVLKDIQMLQDRWCLPAFAVPYAGFAIANYHLNTIDLNPSYQERLDHYDHFWERNYAWLLGQAEAKLLLRYGLQFHIPNPQNILIALSDEMHPQEIIFRDVCDLMFVDSFLDAYDEFGIWRSKDLQLANAYSTEELPIQLVNHHIYLAWKHSVMWFEFSPLFDEDRQIKILHQKWAIRHIQGFAEHIESELGLQIDLGFDLQNRKLFASLARFGKIPEDLPREDKEFYASWLSKWKKDRKEYFDGVNRDREGVEPGRYPAYQQHFLQEAYAIALTKLFKSEIGQRKLREYRSSRVGQVV